MGSESTDRKGRLVQQEDMQKMSAEAYGKGFTVLRNNRSRLVTSCLILLLTLGVVGVGTWGLTDSIKDTNDQVDTAWGLVNDASNTVRLLVSSSLLLPALAAHSVTCAFH